MRQLGLVLFLILVFPHTILIAGAASGLQLATPNEMGVTMGQLYYSVRNVETNQKFWVTLGAFPSEPVISRQYWHLTTF